MDIIRKFREHYKNVDRSYGSDIVYKHNGTLYIFGAECKRLKDKFEEWADWKPAVLDWFFKKDSDGSEYMVVDFSFYDCLKVVLTHMTIIESEEVDYKMYQIVQNTFDYLPNSPYGKGSRISLSQHREMTMLSTNA